MKEKPRVLFLLTSLSVGGSEKKSVRIANALADRGWTVCFAYLDEFDDLRDAVSSRVEVACLQRRGRFGAGALNRLVQLIAGFEPDIVCCINLYPLIYGFLARWMVRFPFKLLATSNETEFVRRKDDLKMYLYSPMLRRSDQVIFGSEYQEKLWTKKYRLDPKKCMHIYNGVDVDYFDNQAFQLKRKALWFKLGIGDTCFVFGSIGRFRKEKQYQVAIKACVELREKDGIDAFCVLVGGGFEEQELRDMVSTLGCEKYVLLLNSVDDVRPYLAAMDVFVLTSISETFSNAALEAMSMNLPVVAPRVGGCPEMIESGENGYIFESENTDEFRDYLRQLASNGALREKMGRSARENVYKRFRFAGMVDSYEAVFSRIAG